MQNEHSWSELVCEICSRAEDEENMIICDACDLGYHLFCNALATQTQQMTLTSIFWKMIGHVVLVMLAVMTLKQCFYLILKIIIALFQCPQGAILDTHTFHHDGMMPRLPPVGRGRLQA